MRLLTIVNGKARLSTPATTPWAASRSKRSFTIAVEAFMKWFVEKDGKQHGPFTGDQLKRLAILGRLLRTDLIRREDQARAISADHVKGLFDHGPPKRAEVSPAPGRTPPPINQPSSLQEGQDLIFDNHSAPARGTTRRQRSLSKRRWTEHPAFVLAAMCAPPAAMFFIWRHRFWSTLTKSAWTFGCLALCLVLLSGQGKRQTGTSGRQATVPNVTAKRSSQQIAPINNAAPGSTYEDRDAAESLSLDNFIAIPTGAQVLGNEALNEDYLPYLPGASMDYLSDALGIRAAGGHLRTRFHLINDGNGLIRNKLSTWWAVVQGRPNLWKTFEPPTEPDPPAHRRVHGGYVEIGSQLSEEPDGIIWEPVLKLNARTGDSWSHTDRFGFSTDYKVMQFFRLNGVPCAVVFLARKIDDDRSIETRWYLKGVGLLRSEARFAAGDQSGQLARREILESRRSVGLAKAAPPASQPESAKRDVDQTSLARSISNRDPTLIEPYDFSKDDLATIPAGAKRIVRSLRIEKGHSDEIGKWSDEEGYTEADGNFVLHGKRALWFDQEHKRKYSEARFLNGQIHGINTLWHPNGKKKGEVPFVHGERHGVFTSWYENGTVSKKIPYKHGKYHGELRYWWPNGQLREITHDLDGKLNGTSQSWEQDGSPNSELTYRDGKLDGKVVRYLTSGPKRGTKALEAVYQDGVLVEPGFPAGSLKRTEFRQKMDELSIQHGTVGRQGHGAVWNLGAWEETFGKPDRIIDGPEAGEYHKLYLYRCSDGPLAFRHLRGGDVHGPYEDRVMVIEVR